jgi:hypothetical protein
MTSLSRSPACMVPVLTLLVVSVLFKSPTCSAGIAPELSLGVSSASDGFATASLEPSLKWSTDGSFFDFCDYSGGINIRSDDTGELPFSVWGAVRKSVAGWNLKAKLDTKSSSLEEFNFDIQGIGGPTNLLVRASGYLENYGSKARSGKVQDVGFTQGFSLPKIGSFLLSPAYNLVSRRAKINVKYDVRNMRILLDATKNQQRVTVAYFINEANTIIPSITSDGAMSVEYQHAVRDAGLFTARYCPNEATTLQYENGPWIASASIPIDGYYKLYAKPKFIIRRSLTPQ